MKSLKEISKAEYNVLVLLLVFIALTLGLLVLGTLAGGLGYLRGMYDSGCFNF